jgi:hypothetical protein
MVRQAGPPFAMGDECRTKGDRSRNFKVALATVRGALGQQVMFQKVVVPAPPAPGGTPTPQLKEVTRNAPVTAPGNRDTAEQFWDRFQAS